MLVEIHLAYPEKEHPDVRQAEKQEATEEDGQVK